MGEDLQEVVGGFVESELLVIGPEVEGIAAAVAVEAVKDVAGEVNAEATPRGRAAVGSLPAERAWAAMLMATLLRRMPVHPLQDVLDFHTLPQPAVVDALRICLICLLVMCLYKFLLILKFV